MFSRGEFLIRLITASDAFKRDKQNDRQKASVEAAHTAGLPSDGFLTALAHNQAFDYTVLTFGIIPRPR